ncbi:hypothetical protein [Sphingomonas flavescens]|jgi:hypothetical protein|uniref:hypothetical protein n=1 Tax=Sphingomonas flavescens TaxID=3132797 RepID=UPI002804C522|nr:hypothetical protein [Sphingomonas limnosediminicola]
MLDTRSGIIGSSKTSVRAGTGSIRHILKEEWHMDLQKFIHMDDRWMWRWYITDRRGALLSMSLGQFSTREEALRDLEAIRLAIAA